MNNRDSSVRLSNEITATLANCYAKGVSQQAAFNVCRGKGHSITYVQVIKYYQAQHDVFNAAFRTVFGS